MQHGRLRARHLEGGKHTERNGITTRDLVTRCLAEASRLQRSICLPTRWKGCSPFRILLVQLSEGSTLRSHSARTARSLARRALDRLPPKAIATDFGLTPHHTSTLTEAACWTADFGLFDEPRGNTRLRFPPSGSSRYGQHALQRVVGGVPIRRRDRTQPLRYATNSNDDAELH